MRQIRVSRAAQKSITRLPPKHRRQVLKKLFFIQTHPEQQDARRLIGYSDLWRADSGEYRIIYSFDTKTVFIDIVGKRNDSTVYKMLQRKRR